MHINGFVKYSLRALFDRSHDIRFDEKETLCDYF